MLGCHFEVTLDIRENAVSTNGLDVDVRLRGTGLSPLMLANEHGLDGRIGHRAPHYLSSDPEHVIAVLCRYGPGPHEVTETGRVWQEVAPIFNNDVRLIFAACTLLRHPRNNVPHHPDGPIIGMEARRNTGAVVDLAICDPHDLFHGHGFVARAKHTRVAHALHLDLQLARCQGWRGSSQMLGSGQVTEGMGLAMDIIEVRNRAIKRTAHPQQDAVLHAVFNGHRRYFLCPDRRVGIRARERYTVLYGYLICNS